MIGAAAALFLMFLIGWLFAPRFLRGRPLLLAVPAYFALGLIAVEAASLAAFQLAGLPTRAMEGRALTLALLVAGAFVFIITGGHRRSRLVPLLARPFAALSASRVRDLIITWRSCIPLGIAVLAVLVLLFWKTFTMPIVAPDALTYHAYLPLEAYREGTALGPVDAGQTNVYRALPHGLSDAALWAILLLDSPDLTFLSILAPLSVALILCALAGLGCELARSARPRNKTESSRPAVPALALLPPALILSDFSMAAFGGDVWDEVPLALLVFLSGDALLRAARDGDWRWAAAASVFAGGAALTKYSGLVVLALLPVALLAAWRPVGVRTTILRLGAVILPGLAIAGLVLARNILLTGNPVHPVLSEVFGGPGAAEFALVGAADGSPFSNPTLRLGNFVFLLTRLVFVLPVAGILIGRPPRWLLAILVPGFGLIAALLAVFSFGGSTYRYEFVALPLLAPAAMWAFARRPSRPRLLAAASLLGACGVIASQVALATGFTPGAQKAGLPYSQSLAYSPLQWSGPGSFYDDSGFQVVFIFGAVAALLLVHVALPRTRGISGRSGDSGSARRPPTIRRVLRWGVPILIALLVLPSIGQALAVRHQFYHDGTLNHSDDEIIGQVYRDDHLMWKWMDENLPAGAKTFSYEGRRLYLKTEIADAASEEFAPTMRGMNPQDAVAFLKERGVTHVLDVQVYRESLPTSVFYQRSAVFQSEWGPLYTLVHKSGNTYLFAIN
ncbi:MAG TPA: hypothetical protein VI893_11060 [Thermoplasmata archaeon]|nr:hypothetical protein [Thermoplasmata archaeon]